MAIYLVDEPFAEIALAYAENDTFARIILLQDASYLACSKTVRAGVYVIRDDVVRRGIRSKIPANVHIIEYGDLIDMLETDKVANFL